MPFFLHFFLFFLDFNPKSCTKTSLFFVGMMVFEADIDGHNGDCTEDGFGEHSETAEAAYRGSAPDGCRSSQTLDTVAVLEDDTGT